MLKELIKTEFQNRNLKVKKNNIMIKERMDNQ